MIDGYIAALADYGVERRLIGREDRQFVINRLLEIMELDSFDEELRPAGTPLAETLDILCDNAAERGVIGATRTQRDLFDTKLMGAMTPFPHEVDRIFSEKYADSPKTATDWFYDFCQDVNYIRRDRTKKDLRWTTPTEYGELEITVNLAKPEKDPLAIAAAGKSASRAYPACQLCPQNEGYAGRIDHPARQNLRIVPIKLCGEDWGFQYSPYVYYNEHCIVLSKQHRHMKVDRASFSRLVDFERQFPHYFIGSNADLPIVGGSILSHDHFQGGRHVMPMERAEIETPITLRGFEDVEAGIVRWPMSVIRLRCGDGERLADAADRILRVWRTYTDTGAGIYASTGGEAHNTVTPIARMRDGKFEMDVVLRCNITSTEHPLGVFHPHEELHHIKKENIGLIEVMGLAILPGRLKSELDGVAHAMLSGEDLNADPALSRHARWALQVARDNPDFCSANADAVLRRETGLVFRQVLEDAGVYKRDDRGRAAFMKFIDAVNEKTGR
jgi:UDPglucose--hexose-1-phosphate uridylyltransferase